MWEVEDDDGVGGGERPEKFSAPSGRRAGAAGGDGRG